MITIVSLLLEPNIHVLQKGRHLCQCGGLFIADGITLYHPLMVLHRSYTGVTTGLSIC
jgi:hypothetical protein